MPPGGLVDRGEPLAAAALRELREEVGVSVSEDRLRLLGVYPTSGKTGAPSCSVVFHARVESPIDVEMSPSEVSECGWFTSGQAATLTVPFDLRAAVDDHFSGRELDVR